MNLKLYLLFSVAFIAFTLCSLQFFELSKISDQATMEAHKGGVLAPDNLPRVLTQLELVERSNDLNNSNATHGSIDNPTEPSAHDLSDTLLNPHPAATQWQILFARLYSPGIALAKPWRSLGITLE